MLSMQSCGSLAHRSGPSCNLQPLSCCSNINNVHSYNDKYVQAFQLTGTYYACLNPTTTSINVPASHLTLLSRLQQLSYHLGLTHAWTIKCNISALSFTPVSFGMKQHMPILSEVMSSKDILDEASLHQLIILKRKAGLTKCCYLQSIFGFRTS